MLAPALAAPDAPSGPVVAPSPIPMVAPRASRLGDLPMITAALEAIAADYVDPSRVDPERMLAGALEGAERAVPRLLAVREALGWRLQIGRLTFDLPGPTLRRLDALRPRLLAVAAVLERELGDVDIVRADPMLTPDQNLEFAMLDGLMRTLDPHSGVVSPSRRFADDPREGDPWVRFGITLLAEPDGWTIATVAPGRSAFASGVRAGSRLVAIDGEAVGRWERAAVEERLVTPPGSPSRWTLQEGTTTREVLVLPERDAAPGVEVRRDGRHLVMTLPRFTDGCAAELLRRAVALGGVGQGGGVVLDLRGNPGGLVRQAAEVADLFLVDGDILGSQRAKDAQPQLSRARPAAGDAAGLEAAPLIVLVDHASASASEIVAAALSVRDRALLVGEPTFGKGTIQAVSGLPAGVRMKLTVAHDVAPAGGGPVGASVQRVGVTPDVLVVPAKLDADMRLMGGASSTRERDLPGALDALGELATSASFAIAPPADPSRDASMSLALGLLDRGGVGRRTAWLGAASLWLASRATEAEGALMRSLAERGVDWRPGTEALAHLEIEVASDIEGGALLPGASRDVAMTVTNRGGEALHRLVGVDVSDGPLRGTEFVFGHVPAGGVKTATVSVSLASEVADRVLRPSIAWHAPVGVWLGSTDLAWPVAPDVRSSLAWRAERQRTSQGGEVTVTVRNEGATTVEGASLWLRSASGLWVDVDAAEATLPSLLPGAEARVTFRVGGDPTGTFQVGLDRGVLPGPPLALADDAGFGVWHANPTVVWSEAEERGNGAAHVPFFGTVQDGDGIARWAFFLDGDKVAMAEGGGARAVPFYADAFLSPGRHEARLKVWDTVGGVTEAREVVLGPPSSRSDRR